MELSQSNSIEDRVAGLFATEPRIAQPRVRFRREVDRTKNVFEANHIIQVGGASDTSRLSEQQWACLGPPQADFSENRRFRGGLSAMRHGFSLARVGYFRNGWAIFHSGNAHPQVETLSERYLLCGL